MATRTAGGDRGEQRHRGCDGPAAGGGGLPRLLRRAPRGPGARAGRGDRGYGGPLRRDFPGEVAALAEAVGDRLDVLVNNAGGAIGADPVAAARAEDWRAMYEVNVIGLLRHPGAASASSRPAPAPSSTSARRRAGSPTRAAVVTPRPSTAPRW